MSAAVSTKTGREYRRDTKFTIQRTSIRAGPRHRSSRSGGEYCLSARENGSAYPSDLLIHREEIEHVPSLEQLTASDTSHGHAGEVDRAIGRFSAERVTHVTSLHSAKGDTHVVLNHRPLDDHLEIAEGLSEHVEHRLKPDGPRTAGPPGPERPKTLLPGATSRSIASSLPSSQTSLNHCRSSASGVDDIFHLLVTATCRLKTATCRKLPPHSTLARAVRPPHAYRKADACRRSQQSGSATNFPPRPFSTT